MLEENEKKENSNLELNKFNNNNIKTDIKLKTNLTKEINFSNSNEKKIEKKKTKKKYF